MSFTHLLVHEQPTDGKRKTKVWTVRSKYGENALLGTIAWMNTWRKYAFYPEPNCVFEERCMRELSNFIVLQTSTHKDRDPTIKLQYALQENGLLCVAILEDGEPLAYALMIGPEADKVGRDFQTLAAKAAKQPPNATLQ